MNRELKQRILSALAEHPRGLTISAVSEELDIHRATAAKYLKILKVEEQVEQQGVGQAKLHYISAEDIDAGVES